MLNCGKGRNHPKKHLKGSSGVKVQSRVSSVPFLCMEAGGSSCICTLPSFSWELQAGAMASLPGRVAHRACTSLTLALTAQKLAPGVRLGWFLVPPRTEQTCSAQLWIDAAYWHEAFPGMLLLLGLVSVPPGKAFLSPHGIDAYKQVRYDTPHGSSLVQSRRAIPFSILSLPWAKQIVPKVPCKMWFYMVPTDKAIMKEGCSVSISPQTSQGKSKDLE